VPNGPNIANCNLFTNLERNIIRRLFQVGLPCGCERPQMYSPFWETSLSVVATSDCWATSSESFPFNPSQNTPLEETLLCRHLHQTLHRCSSVSRTATCQHDLSKRSRDPTMSFLGTSLGASTASSAPDMQRNKEAFMASVRNEMALLNAQQLINKCNEKCFQKCVTKPGTSLSGSEEACLSRCIDRYLEAFNIVSRAYTDRLKERQERP